jgi:hypothetical protein
MYVKTLACSTTSQSHRSVASSWYIRQSLPNILYDSCLVTCIDIYTYIHAYTHIHTFLDMYIYSMDQ